MVKSFIYKCEVAESYWEINAQSVTCSHNHVRVYGASVCSLHTLLKLATNEDLIFWRHDIDKVIEDYRLKNDDTDTWLLAV